MKIRISIGNYKIGINREEIIFINSETNLIENTIRITERLDDKYERLSGLFYGSSLANLDSQQKNKVKRIYSLISEAYTLNCMI